MLLVPKWRYCFLHTQTCRLHWQNFPRLITWIWKCAIFLRCLPGKVLFEIRLKSEILHQTITVIIVAFLRCFPGKVLFSIRLKSEILYQMILAIIVAW